MLDDLPTKKSLGQHWLRDEESLQAIVKSAGVNKDDTVLEIGPGLGTLTKILVKKARKVVAVEFDDVLANRLFSEVGANNLVVRHQDILSFDLGELPPTYKVVANIPYYLTGNLIRRFTETPKMPEVLALLVQKEVAERLAAEPGNLSIIAIAAQLHYEVSLGEVIKSELFTPPPKIDSQVVIFTKRKKPLFKDMDFKAFMRLVKAGFSSPRKKLRSSLAAGLNLSKEEADAVLKKAKISGDLRAQNLNLKDWNKISQVIDN